MHAILFHLKGTYRNLSISALEFYTYNSNAFMEIRRDRGPVAVELDQISGKRIF